MKIRRPSVRIAAAAGAISLAALFSGCSYMNPIQTHEFYQPAEGSVENLFPSGNPGEPVGLRNVYVVVDSSGKPTVVGGLANDTTEDQQVTLVGKNGDTELFSTTVTVPAQGMVSFGQEIPAIEVSSLGGAKPGDNVDFEFSVGGESLTATIPVLDESLGYTSQNE